MSQVKGILIKKYFKYDLSIFFKYILHHFSLLQVSHKFFSVFNII